MKKLLLDIVYNLTYLVLYMVAYPVTLTGFIVGSIKHESKEQCCRRAFRLRLHEPSDIMALSQ